MSPSGAPEELSIPSLNRTDPQRFFNRELSWLHLNKRVLEEAEQSDHPLLERLRFLSLSAADLDKFNSVRAAGLGGSDSLTPAEQRSEINALIRKIVAKQASILTELRIELSEQNFHFLDERHLGVEDKIWLETYFFENIFPVLTPIGLDPSLPFPLIPNTAVTLVFDLFRTGDTEHEMYALLPLPWQLSRFVQMPENTALIDRPAGLIRFVRLETIVGLFVQELFPGYRVRAHGVFQALRHSTVDAAEKTGKLGSSYKPDANKSVDGQVMRLDADKHMPEYLRHFLIKELHVSEKETFIQEGMVGLSDLSEVITQDRPDLLFEPYSTRCPRVVRERSGDIFSAITQNDVLVHHPYESFYIVPHFLQQGAVDPDVISIKWTLGRASDRTAIVQALKDAAENGKSVTAITELKTRLGALANECRELENAGVHVLYGSAGRKSHANIGQIVRRETETLNSYVYISTQNDQSNTAIPHADLSLFTADKSIVRDIIRVFDYITSSARPEKLEVLSISPHGIRDRILDHIREEIYHAKAGRPAQIWLKTNSLADEQVIDALYEASGAGVEIELVVRGICCLRPGIPGLSENIRVKSIIGRLFEHARIYCFGAGHGLPSDKSVVYISSADLKPKNLDSRVEVMVPVTTQQIHQQILDQIMQANLADNKQSWRILSDGLSERFVLKDEKKAFNMHTYFMNNPCLSGLEKSLGENFPSVTKRV